MNVPNHFSGSNEIALGNDFMFVFHFVHMAKPQFRFECRKNEFERVQCSYVLFGFCLAKL